MMCTMITRQERKSENFGNLLSDYYNKATDSDLVLYISDLSDPNKLPLLIYSHLLVLRSASDFIRRYLSCFSNDPSRCQLSNANPVVPNQLQLSIPLDYASNNLDDSLLTLFFSLFYVNRFDETHLGRNGLADQIHHNILHLYQLSLYFCYDTLTSYIEQYFKATMCLTYFTPLSNFCPQKDPFTGKYLLEKARGATVYNRLAQWYTCCVRDSSSLCEEEEEAGPASEERCNKQYFEQKKRAILADLATVENCRLPKKEARRLSESSIRLDYHRNLCAGCMSDSNKENTVGAYYYLDLGCLALQYGNGVEQFFLRLKKKRRPDSQQSVLQDNKIELTMNRKHTPPAQKKPRNGTEQWMPSSSVIEEDGERYTCDSRIVLLSKKTHKDKSLQKYKKKSLSLPTEINSFDVHAAKHCYEGHCDQCNTLKPVYILMMRILLSREGTNANASPEDMTMSVEDPVYK